MNDAIDMPDPPDRQRDSLKLGALVLVGTPIGHPDDFSGRGIATLREADVIACEEMKEARRLLRRYDIETPLLAINEHTEHESAEDVLSVLRSGKTVALISDCGMPVFADPGTRVVQLAIREGITVRVVPGPTSLTTALAISGFDVTRFFFYGFLSAKRPQRIAELRAVKSQTAVLVFLDAPYRLNQLLADLTDVLGATRRACIACDLTLPSEHVERGTLAMLRSYFADHPGKREFVVLVEGAGQQRKR